MSIINNEFLGEQTANLNPTKHRKRTWSLNLSFALKISVIMAILSVLDTVQAQEIKTISEHVLYEDISQKARTFNFYMLEVG